jgi:GNAT superfamily N-acetyltransferase
VAVIDEDQVIAMLALHDDWVEQLYVSPVRQGQGVGRALIELAKRRRPAGLQLWTFAANEPARRFYERSGFVAVEETDGSGNEERAPDIRYVHVETPGPAARTE